MLEGLLTMGTAMISGTLALALAAAFSGASFYVNWVEQPARLKLDEEALLSEWGPSDSRGVSLLATIALVAAVAGFIAYFSNRGRGVFEHAYSRSGRYRAMTAYLFLAPGTPMLFQGQEFAASSPFLYFSEQSPEIADVIGPVGPPAPNGVIDRLSN